MSHFFSFKKLVHISYIAKYRRNWFWVSLVQGRLRAKMIVCFVHCVTTKGRR